jgi:hypothetical protein
MCGIDHMTGYSFLALCKLLVGKKVLERLLPLQKGKRKEQKRKISQSGLGTTNQDYNMCDTQATMQ